MKKLLTFIFCLFCLYSTAFASYTGTYMFTATGNDKEQYTESIEDRVNQWFLDNGILYESDLEFLKKLEDGDEGGDENFSFCWSDATHTSGSWTSENKEVKFYSVKAGDQYAMYWVGENVFNGLFSTEHLFVGTNNNPALSHITFWTNNNTYTEQPIPEPSTFILVGLGLLFFVHKGRQKLSLMGNND